LKLGSSGRTWIRLGWSKLFFSFMRRGGDRGLSRTVRRRCVFAPPDARGVTVGGLGRRRCTTNGRHISRSAATRGLLDCLIILSTRDALLHTAGYHACMTGKDACVHRPPCATPCFSIVCYPTQPAADRLATSTFTCIHACSIKPVRASSARCRLPANRIHSLSTGMDAYLLTSHTCMYIHRSWASCDILREHALK
jgi:hypothetical protein